MEIIDATAAFTQLTCVQRSGPHVSRPYLWTTMYTIDGSTVAHPSSTVGLSGQPVTSFGEGRQGNLAKLESGESAQISRDVGVFRSQLHPVELNIFDERIAAPGILGIIALLVEEDSTSEARAAAARAAANELIRRAIEDLVPRVDVAFIQSKARNRIDVGDDPESAVGRFWSLAVDNAASAYFGSELDRATDTAAAILKAGSAAPDLIVGHTDHRFMSFGIPGDPPMEFTATLRTQAPDGAETIYELVYGNQAVA